MLWISSVVQGATWPDGPWRQVAGNPGHQVNDEALEILGLAANDTRVVAVGEKGLLRYANSPDSWRNAVAPAGGTLNAVAWLRNEFICVGDGGRMLMSADGILWTSKLFPGTQDLLSIIEGDGNVLMTDVEGGVWNSTDLEQWTRSVIRTDIIVTSAARGRGLWVATAVSIDGGTVIGRIFSSADGRTWTERQSAGDAFYAVSFTNGRFVVVGEKFPSLLGSLWNSSDGISWSIGALGLVGGYRAIAQRGSKWVILGDGPTQISSDGVTWALSDPINSFHPSGVNAAVAFAGQVVTGSAYTWNSSDLVNWTQPSDPPLGILRRVTWGEKGFVAVGDEGAAAWSADGLNWSPVSVGSSLNIADVTYGAGVYVATAFYGIFVSNDGRHWRGQQVENRREFHAVRYLRGQFFAIAGDAANSGSIWTSPDAATWIERTPPGSNKGFYDIADDGTKLLVTGFNGLCTTSTNGVAWTPPRTTTFYTLSRLAFLGGRFIALTDRGAPDVVTSFDGQSWTEVQAVPRSLGERANASDLAIVADEAVLTNSGFLAVSADGVNWRPVTVDKVLSPAFGYAHGDGVGVLVGGYQIALGSGPARPTITAQPLGAGVALNTTTMLSVGLTDTTGTSVRWFRDGQPVTGATAMELPVTPRSTADYGQYYAEVTKQAVREITTSVSVTPPAPTERLLNLSVRADVAGNANGLIAGFVIDGPEPVTVLLRAIGPGLRAFGVADALGDPQLTLRDQSGNIWVMEGAWNQFVAAGTSAAAARRVAAFPLAPASADAAATLNLPPGAYTMQANSISGASGNAMLELYALEIGRGRLSNLSSRSRIDPARGPLIVGFVVTGATPQNLLLRGVGPALQGFGVQGAVADPRIVVYDALRQIVVSNDDWAASAGVSAREVGAFPLTPGSKDAALTVALQPGAYTMHVFSDTSGVGLAEAYLIPANAP